MADVYRANVEGAGPLAIRFRKAAAKAASVVARELAGLGDLAIVVYRGRAQRDTGRLHRGITRRGGGLEFTVRADAVNPESGYDYVGVTRFGHAVARIYPKHSKALRTPFGPRASVRGYKPASDWAEDSFPAIRSHARSVSSRIGRQIIAEI